MSDINTATNNGTIRQSIVRWTYNQLSLDALCEAAAKIGYFGIDVLAPDEFHVPKRFGLRCTMGFVGIGDNKAIGINRVEHHVQFERSLRQHAPIAQSADVTNVIALCGSRAADLSDEQGAKNSIQCLKRLAPIAADYGITLCLEPQNSKRDHPGYMCDRIAWAVNVCEEVASPQVKLLFDIYHVQVMEGDLIETIRSNSQWFHHYHTGGVPGRHELDSKQEINYPAVMRTIAGSGFSGVVAHEYIPTLAPIESLQHAYNICDV